MDEFEQALVEFQRRDLEYGIGFAGHGTMAADALVRLGHASLIPALVDVLAPRMPPLPEGQPIPSGEWSGALGDYERRGDWIATWRACVAEGDWRLGLQRALPLLVDGAFASAAHGLLRTAHAVRALEDRDSHERRVELAHGLALWAARFQRLPGSPGSAPAAGRGPREALAAVPPLAPERRRPGLFSDAVRELEGDEAFAAALARVDLEAAEPGAWLSELCAAAAEHYLANPGARIAYAHCITAPSALRRLLPYLDAAQQRAALGVVFQCVAALHAISAGEPELPDARRDLEVQDRARLAGELAELRYRAAVSLEEHAIKLTEACLREHAIAASEALRLAAADAALALGARSWG